MSRLDILVYIDWFSPGFKAGGPIRSMVNLAHHMQGDIRFHIISSDQDYMSEVSYDEVPSGEWMSYKGGHEVIYLSKKDQNYRGIKQAIGEKRFDRIYINGLYSKVFSIFPLWIHRHERKKITLAPRGMLKASARQFKSTQKSVYLGMAKILGCYRHVRFHATDELEEKDIQCFSPKNEILLSPNLARPLIDFNAIKKEGQRLKLVFIGRIAPEKNLLFALKVLSLIDIPIHFQVYGAIYDSEYWQECIALIAAMESEVQVSHEEAIDPDKVIQVLQSSHALFFPTQGENFGHVILESLMAGRPVICSDQTPWRGLEASGAGMDLPLNDMVGFIRAIKYLSEMKEEQYQSLCKSSYKLGAHFCNDHRNLDKAKALFLH